MGEMQERLDEVMALTERLSKGNPTETRALLGFLNKAEAGRALSQREKELINVGLAVAAQCEWCIAFHVQAAAKAGKPAGGSWPRTRACPPSPSVSPPSAWSPPRRRGAHGAPCWSPPLAWVSA